MGVDALIVMPKSASLMKAQNTRNLGAEVLLEGETYDEAFRAAVAIAKKNRGERSIPGCGAGMETLCRVA